MNGEAVAILGGIILVGFNAFKFEQMKSKHLENLKPGLADLEALESIAPDHPQISHFRNKIQSLRAAAYLNGNWLPASYRQFILSSIIVLGSCAAFGTRTGFFTALITFPLFSMKFLLLCIRFGQILRKLGLIR